LLKLFILSIYKEIGGKIAFGISKRLFKVLSKESVLKKYMIVQKQTTYCFVWHILYFYLLSLEFQWLSYFHHLLPVI